MWPDPHASFVTWRRNGPWLPSAQECLCTGRIEQIFVGSAGMGTKIVCKCCGNLKTRLPPCATLQELMGNWVDMQGQPVVAVAWAECTTKCTGKYISHFDAGLTTCQ